MHSSIVFVQSIRENLLLYIKSDGVVVRILDSAKALLKWMILGPVIASVITKVNLDITNATIHHENNQPFEQKKVPEKRTLKKKNEKKKDKILYTVVSKKMTTQ